ncbi:MAG: ribosome maturation factor RimM [Propionibacteriaceae bacterium]|nr:ribosome maturation factor RimM [Propionibacteriaceae bacterium]
MSEQLIVGTIGRAHGLRGQVTVRPRTDSIAERFAPGAVLQAGGRSLTVAAFNLQQGRLVVAFTEVTDRSAAEDLRGLDLTAIGVPDALEADEYHDTELIGLAAVDPAGNSLGDVVAVHHNPTQDLLVLRTPGGERLVPFVTYLVPEVDPAAGRVVINPIPGLLTEVPDAD